MGLVYEAASGCIKGLFKDTGTDTAIQPSTLTIFIYDRDTETALLGTAGSPTNLTPVSTYVSAGGVLLYYIPAANNGITTVGKNTEIHVARLAWTWTAQGATQTGKEELGFEVINLSP